MAINPKIFEQYSIVKQEYINEHSLEEAMRLEMPYLTNLDPSGKDVTEKLVKKVINVFQTNLNNV